ncbi:AraC family transcriptional regulator [Myroides albus]|uniref:Helix-turn-helix domain-containing protein n=1 Tax=Myroides albus TaxID=2562892 RepID=A0A6I3LGK8_9FLAO|nr:AraC family transcriptional regulator [Myroides albus]MTG97333.1 helix-turn-helix domain-containing protein [Myroides albus]UVD80581.1 AraC family transcriptional regulator [Myroides albus]
MRYDTLESIAIREITLHEDSVEIQSTSQLLLVYILQGKGVSVYESHEVPFQKGKLYVIPFNTHYLFLSKECTLLVIECPQTFITQIRMEADRIETCDNINKLTYITHNYHAKGGCVFHSKEDETFAEHLLRNIQREYQQQALDYLIIRQSVSILLNLIARNLIQCDYKQVNENKKVQDVMSIITYVQKNIKDREKLSIEVLANTFGISKNYFGEYFKKQIGISLQDYILNYKLKLVETRLKYSTMRLKEIAFELDFNDESHLSKFFKKHTQLSPTQYRNLHREK